MRVFAVFFVLVFCFSCEQNYAPKPLVYHRIDLPKQTQRVAVNSPCAWESYASKKSVFKVDKDNKCWITWAFPQYHAEVFLTYLPIDKEGDLRTLLDEMHQLSFEHQQQANAIDVVANTLESGNLTLEYNVTGNAATPYQFCITDSTNNYLRGALYFRNTPNYDSIQPVLNYLKSEVKVYMDSLKWKAN